MYEALSWFMSEYETVLMYKSQYNGIGKYMIVDECKSLYMSLYENG